MRTYFKCFPLVLFLALIYGCSNEAANESGESGLTPVVLQTDWYAQPEHGGFYQALAKGFYEEEGLDVEIRPGGGINGIPQLIAVNRVQFGVGAIQTLMIYRSRGIPLVSLFPYFQHDPQCVLFHPESGIKTLQDLNGREVMFQADNIYLYFIEAMGIDFQLLPMDWGLARFMSDKEFVQQCFLTSEPLVVRRQGITPGVIPLSESGFDPYRHTYTNEKMIAEQPETVAAFTRASLRGWADFMANDPAPAFALIREANPEKTDEVMQETLDQMKHYNLTEGDSAKGERLGQYDMARLRQIIKQMRETGLLDGEIKLNEVVAFELMPEGLLVDSEKALNE